MWYSNPRRLFFLVVTALLAPLSVAAGMENDATDASQPAAIEWSEDYEAARQQAVEQQRFLLIYFRGDDSNPSQQRFESETLIDPEVVRLASQHLAVRVDLDATISVKSQPVRLLNHASFQHMNGHPGLAIVDCKSVGQPYYKHTVGCLPFERPVYYAPPYQSKKSVATFLDLPPGTITQRMMVYAVRLHPELPASTVGAPHPILFDACNEHSQLQADMRLQGHHHWESRFHQIWNRTGGQHPTEVCAESWPGKTMLAACIDCVHSWRQSSGHWSAVRRVQPAYGYDIRRGSNGIWYATGIFGAGNPAALNARR